MVEDCKALVRGCPWCHKFEGVIPKVPLCPIRVHAPLELVHVDFTSVESTMELNKLPSIENILFIMDHFTRYALAVVTKDQTAKTIAKMLYERFVMVFGAQAKLLSNWGVNFTSVLVEELCTMFGIQKCQTTVYHPQCNGQKWYYDRATSTIQLMLGDVVLMKLDVFQVKREAKDRWSKVEYVVTHQVANDMPRYKVKDDGRNVKVAHHKRLFLVAPMRDTTMPLGGSESGFYVGTTRSALVELTPLECGGETSESEVEGALTQHPTSCILLGWVDGILWPLPSVALRPTVYGLRSGDRTSSFSDEDVH